MRFTIRTIVPLIVTFALVAACSDTPSGTSAIAAPNAAFDKNGSNAAKGVFHPARRSRNHRAVHRLPWLPGAVCRAARDVWPSVRRVGGNSVGESGLCDE